MECISCQCRKKGLSSDADHAKEFVVSFKYIVEQDLSLNQVFNCHETGLDYRLLPDVTLGTSFEKVQLVAKKRRKV